MGHFTNTTAAARLTHLIECPPYDAVAGATIDVRLTTAAGWNTRSTDTPAGAIYVPGARIEGFGCSIVDVENAFVGGLLEAREGEIRVPNTDGRFNGWLRYSWIERTLTVYKVAKGAAHSSRTVAYKGYVTGATVGQKEARIAFESFNAKLTRTKVTSSKFWGRPRALRFTDLTAHYVSCANKCNLTGSATIEVFYRQTATGSAAQYLVKKQSGTTGYYASITAASKFRASFDGGVTTVTSSAALTPGVWYWLTAVFDDTNNLLALYINGVLDTQASYAVGPPGNTLHTLYLGGDGATASANGDIGEIRIWSRALTAREVNQYLYGGLQVGATGLIGWWRMAEGTGTALNDETSSNADGTITGATWIGTYEGDESVGGRRRPWGIGTPQHAELTLIDSQKLIYAIDVRGFAAATTPAVYDGGVALTSGGDWADLWSTTVAAGGFKFDSARGLVRLNAVPTFRPSICYESKLVGAGAYGSFRPWTAIEAILTESAGFTSSDIDSSLVQTSSSTSFSGWTSGDRVQLYSVDGELTCSDAISHILKAFRARGGFDDTGVFRAKDLTKANVPNSVAWSLDENDLKGVVAIASLPPIKEILLRFTPYWPAYQVAEIAGAVTEATSPSRSDLQKDFRELRFTRPADRYGRVWTDYKKDAREIVEEIYTGLPSVTQLGTYADALFDAHDTYCPVWEGLQLNPAKTPAVGDVIQASHPACGLAGGGVKCLVVGSSRSIVGARAMTKLQFMDATTLAS